MAVRGKKSKAQMEVPGTASPNRIDDLHALGVEIYDLQEQRKKITKDERVLRIRAAEQLKAHHIDHYHVDGVEVWAEPGPEKVKVAMDESPEDQS
jgi:hypothetical protein